jgi:hypothetical protein
MVGAATGTAEQNINLNQVRCGGHYPPPPSYFFVRTVLYLAMVTKTHTMEQI